MQNDANFCDISLYKILIGVGGVGHDGWGGVWWVMLGEGYGGSCRGGVVHTGVGWGGWVMVGWGMVDHAGVGSYWGEWGEIIDVIPT